VGYRGKVGEREAARGLRARGWTMNAIAAELGVSKSSVSLWTRDVPVEGGPARTGGRRREPNVLQRRKAAEIAELMEEGRRRIGELSEREFLVAGAMLYAGEGAKRDGAVKFANTDPRLVRMFCVWLRRFFEVDESRLRGRLYLHDGLDLEAAMEFWTSLTAIPPQQFIRPYRAVADAGYRSAKHPLGCVTVSYACSHTHRSIMGLMAAVLEPPALVPAARPEAGTVTAFIPG
jgi:transcriptional regulator with XRE-family HTH domain